MALILFELISRACLKHFSDFSNSNRKDDSRIILLPARLLIDKGVYEFVDAAKIVKKKYPDWIFVLVGAADYDNPSSIDQKTIKEALAV